MTEEENIFKTLRDLVLKIEDISSILYLPAIQVDPSQASQEDSAITQQLHVHDDLEIRFLFDENNNLQLKRIAIIPPNTPHTALTQEELYRHLSIGANESEFYCMKRNMPVITAALKKLEDFEGFQARALFKALKKHGTNPIHDPNHIRILLAALLTLLYKCLCDNTKPKEYHSAEVIATYIRTNYFRKDLTISEIAQYHRMSANYIQQVFRSYWGCTPVQFLNKIRLEAAKILLKKHCWQIKEVAFMCGWNYPHYFCKKYKEHFGHSPSEEE